MQVETIVFDFGGVLIDWNPRHLYRKVFADEQEMEVFLKEICTDEWNLEQDRGRSLAEATQLLAQQFPDKAEYIAMYYGRWPEMLNGPIQGTVDLLAALKKNYPVYGLTNWSNETFPIALQRYEFLQWFDGILVSGDEKLIKPSPEIFDLLASRYHINPATAVFIDDNLKNVTAAAQCGYQSIHYTSPEQLKQALEAKGIII